MSEREDLFGSRGEEWSSKETKRGAESKPDNEPAGGSAVVRRLRGGTTLVKIRIAVVPTVDRSDRRIGKGDRGEEWSR